MNFAELAALKSRRGENSYFSYPAIVHDLFRETTVSPRLG
jgi:hypothetical protein